MGYETLVSKTKANPFTLKRRKFLSRHNIWWNNIWCSQYFGGTILEISKEIPLLSKAEKIYLGHNIWWNNICWNNIWSNNI